MVAAMTAPMALLALTHLALGSSSFGCHMRFPGYIGFSTILSFKHPLGSLGIYTSWIGEK
jgi:hypothetical protein